MGFVGSHTAKSLRAMGATVIGVDNRVVGDRAKFCDAFLEGDYADPEILSKLNQHNVSGFVHCAGSSLVGPSMKNPSQYYNNNVVKTIQMLDRLRNWMIKPWIVFSSSAAVYGIPQEVPIPEMSPMSPISPYGQSKLMIEKILFDYSEAYQLRSFSLRYFNACGADVWDNELGPEDGDTHLIPRIFEAYHEGRPFTLYGTDYDTNDGTCIRDYIHVCDLALAHGTACRALLSGAKTNFYNLGTSRGTSNQEIIDKFKFIVGDLQVIEEPRRPGDPDCLVADATRFMKDTGFVPQFSDMETIIKSTDQYYQINKVSLAGG